MANCLLELSCSECSDDISALCTPWHNLTPSSKPQQLIGPDVPSTLGPPTGLLSDADSRREELEVLLMREQKGQRLWNYLPQHSFLTQGHRQVLVAHISNVS